MQTQTKAGIGPAMTGAYADINPRAIDRLLSKVVDQPDVRDAIQRAMNDELLGDAAQLEQRGDKYQVE